MTAFPDAAALDYDQRITRLVPGYLRALEAMAAALALEVGGSCRILVPGCGTGTEIALASRHLPEARFTALDPSAGMIVAARTKLTAAGLGARVSHVHGRLEDLEYTLHDAAMLTLVLHFLPDDGAKVRFLRQIADRLRPDAPLLLLDPQHDQNAEGALRGWLLQQNHSEAGAEAILDRARTQWHCISAERSVAMLEEAGFHSARIVYKELNYVATIARRGDGP